MYIFQLGSHEWPTFTPKVVVVVAGVDDEDAAMVTASGAADATATEVASSSTNHDIAGGYCPDVDWPTYAGLNTSTAGQREPELRDARTARGRAFLLSGRIF